MMGRKSASETNLDDVRVVLVAHGSRDPRWRATFEDLAAGLDEAVFRLAYMEFSSPTLMDVAEDSVREGIMRLRLLPLFMAGGAHVARDIPALAAEVRQRFEGLEIDILPPIGEDPRFVSLLRELIEETATAGRSAGK